MKAVVLHEYGGPEKLKFEDNVPDPTVSEDTVLIAAIAADAAGQIWSADADFIRMERLGFIECHRG